MSHAIARGTKGKAPSRRSAGRGLRCCAAYFVVLLVSVSVRVAVPSGVSTREVVVERERSVVDSGLVASTVTFVDELDGAAGGFTIVVEEVDAGGAAASLRTTVSFSFTTGAWATLEGSFTTVVDDVLAGRSHPASAAATAMMAVGRTYFIDVSIGKDMALRQRYCAA